MEVKVHDRCWMMKGEEKRPVTVFYVDEKTKLAYVYDTLSGWGGYVKPETLTFRRQEDY
jgi:hypothetical protein